MTEAAVPPTTPTVPVAPTVPAAPTSSRYLEYLPAIFLDQADDRQSALLTAFLGAFEAVLSGVGDAGRPGLGEIIGGIPGAAPALAALHRYCEPGPGQPPSQCAPQEFLGWLAGWVALALRADLDQTTQREFIAKAVSLYRWRGTRKGLEDMLSIYTRLRVDVQEYGEPMRVGTVSTVGHDTILGGGPPHFFRVNLYVPSPAQRASIVAIATEIINAEKPAHCYYDLRVDTKSLQVGATSRVGYDTLLPIGA